MTLETFILNGLKEQLNLFQSVTKAMLKPPSFNAIGQVASLLNVLGGISRRQVIKQTENTFRPIAIPIRSEGPPIESIKGIGRKIGGQLRSYGIQTIADLKAHNPNSVKIPGISCARIQKWQNNL